MDPSIIDVTETSYKKYLDDTVQKRALVPRSDINTNSNLELSHSSFYGKPELVRQDERDGENRQAWFFDTPGIINDNQVCSYPIYINFCLPYFQTLLGITEYTVVVAAVAAALCMSKCVILGSTY